MQRGPPLAVPPPLSSAYAFEPESTRHVPGPPAHGRVNRIRIVPAFPVSVWVSCRRLPETRRVAASDPASEIAPVTRNVPFAAVRNRATIRTLPSIVEDMSRTALTVSCAPR
jgi:hypothetical protein